MTGWTLTIDIDAAGKQLGHVVFPSSAGLAPFLAPIACVSRGKGATTVLTAGVHGDEYEGQVALSDLARELLPEDVAGRVIIVPCCNVPACAAGMRLSPVDGLDLNRVFPGSPNGSLTERIAGFIEAELFRRADYACDLHTGGVIMQFLPATIIVVTGDRDEDSKRVALASAFGAHHCLLFDLDTMGAGVGMESGMMRHDVIGISGEFGGTGSLTETSLCRAGIRSVLAHTGNMPAGSQELHACEPKLIDLRRADAYVLAPSPGVVEVFAMLGTEVAAGDTLALLHHPDQTGMPPTVIRAHLDGMVVMRRAVARVGAGDWLFAIGQPVDTL